MSGRARRAGLLGAGALVAFYVVVLAAAAGWEHLRNQARQDWWLLAPIVAGFAASVALTVELRRLHRAHGLGSATSAGAGASTVGMVACCAHHLADLLPVVGATGTAAALLDWRVPLMLGGIGVNAVAVAVAWRRLRDARRDREGMAACAA